MEKTREEAVIEIFKQLTPVNQRQFMTMLRVAETAEDNARRAMDNKNRFTAPDGMQKKKVTE